MKNFSSRYILISVILAGVFMILATLIGLAIINNNNSNQDYNFISEEIKTFPIELDVKDINNKITKYTSSSQSGEDVLTFMKNLQAKDNSFKFKYSTSDYAVLITSINGYEANSDKREFWKLFINNQDNQVDYTEYNLKEGDVLLWEIDHF